MSRYIWRPVKGAFMHFLRAMILVAAMVSFNTTAQTGEPEICEIGGCNECDGGVLSLTLQFNGDPGSVIEIGDVVDGSGMPFGTQVLDPGDEFTIMDEDGDKLSDPEIFVNGNEDVKIHTSCSQETGPGAIWGSFTVVEGVSKNGGPICPAPECLECKGGVLSLSLIYNGLASAVIEVIDDKETRFGPEVVVPGGSVSFTGVDGDKLDGPIILVNNQENVEIHTSCSQPIGPGAVWGLFTVESGVSKDNGNICPEPECQECKDGVLSLTLQFNGDSGSVIEIDDDDVVDGSGMPFGTRVLNQGDEFTIMDEDGGKLSDPKIFVNGNEDVKIHTSCSQEVGPGAVLGSFTVSAGTSKKGGNICPAPECLECKGGVVSMSVAFNGDMPAEVQVFDDNETVFGPQQVTPGQEFDIVPSGDKLKDTTFFVNGVEDVELHTSCSQPIGPGTVWGSFTVTQSSSKDNGPICPVDPLLCDECKGGVTKMTMRYFGSVTANVEVVDKDGIILFGPADLATNEDISFSAADGEKLTKDVFIYVDGVENTKLHTSCSQDISPGTVWGSFQVRESFSVDNGPICGCTFSDDSFDFGDAPASYDDGPDGPASHVLTASNVYMGVAPDADAAPQSSAFADGDDTNEVDDEGDQLLIDDEGEQGNLCDGENILRRSADNAIIVNITGNGVMSVWADWNNDGSYAGNLIVADLVPSAGAVSFDLTPPVTSSAFVFVRFRFSSQTGLGPTGPATDGEVEDCQIQVEEDDG